MYDNNQAVDFIIIDSVLSLSRNEKQEMAQGKNDFKMDFFAHTINIGIDPSSKGIRNRVDTGIQIWRLGITSTGATSLGITFDPFVLLPGIRVFLYTPDGSNISGAFTFRNNKPDRLLTVASLPGDSLIIEIQSCNNQESFGELSVATVSVGFKTEKREKTGNDEWYGRSADCHVDINCISDPFIQQQKYATCRLIIESINGRTRCTGTLLNNVSQDGLPYVLTAGHCITNAYAASHTIAFFDYESPYCDGPDGEIHSVSGSTLLSRASSLDFALIELSEKPPVDYYPVYSGWNAVGNSFDYSYSIHHPQGDVKKFCNDSDRVQTGSFLYFDPGTHWLIPDYEIGTTENGSSGGALFDNNNRLVGTLSGGGEECSETINDYYQKFDAAWDSYTDTDAQLKAWLDPDNTGTRILNNLEPFQGIIEMLSNIQPDDSTTIIPVANWGYISGHNSLYSSAFAEHYYRNGSKYIYALKLNVSKAYASNINSGIKIMVWEGDDLPEQLIFEKDFYLFEFPPESETSIRLDTLILVDRHFFIGYSINYIEPSDTFALYTAIHDDMSENSSFMSRHGSWEYLNDGVRSYSASLAISPLVLDYYPENDSDYGEFPFEEVTIYPNPTSGILQILLKNKPEGDVYITIYNLTGNIIYKEQVFQPEPNFQFHVNENIRQGMYLMKLEYNDKMVVKKFIKLP